MQGGVLRFHRRVHRAGGDYTAALTDLLPLAACAALDERGLNLRAALPTREAAAAVPELSDEAEVWPTTLLVGSTGGAMWGSIRDRGFLDRADPVDEHALEALEAFVRALPTRARLIWPLPHQAPLAVMGLGKLVGWNRRSPLGLGLHPEHGLWVAYRGVLLLKQALPRTEAVGAHACLTCIDRPCVPACPADAVGEAGIDPLRCLGERESGGDCATRCLARLACPVGRDSTYPLAQIAHHHRASTAMLQRHARGDA